MASAEGMFTTRSNFTMRRECTTRSILALPGPLCKHRKGSPSLRFHSNHKAANRPAPYTLSFHSQRAENGGLDPSWLNLAFGAPRFSVQRSQNPLKSVFWGLWTENWGAPKTSKKNHHGSNRPFSAF